MLKKLAALVSVPLLALSLAACSAGEGASKEEVTAGMSKALSAELESMGLAGLDQKVVDDYATCIIDKSYDSLSASTRDLIAAGDYESIDEAKVPQKEYDAVTDAVEGCQENLVNALMQ